VQNVPLVMLNLLIMDWTGMASLFVLINNATRLTMKSQHIPIPTMHHCRYTDTHNASFQIRHEDPTTTVRGPTPISRCQEGDPGPKKSQHILPRQWRDGWVATETSRTGGWLGVMGIVDVSFWPENGTSDAVSHIYKYVLFCELKG